MRGAPEGSVCCYESLDVGEPDKGVSSYQMEAPKSGRVLLKVTILNRDQTWQIYKSLEKYFKTKVVNFNSLLIY